MTQKQVFFAFLAGLALLFWAGMPVIASLAVSWQTEEYSHGYFIPFVAFLLGWHRLAEHKPAPSASWLGALALLGGVGLMAVGRLASFEPVSHYGFLLSLAGLTWAAFGGAVIRTLWPSFAYLLFAIPLPRLIYVALSADLQLLSSTLGVLPLKLLGISVYQDGNIIDLGTARLQVVEACSGLRYLFPLMSFGFLTACLFEGRFWKKALLFLSTIPITIVINALRISIIGVTVEKWGSHMAEGLLHDLEGWSLFLICMALLAAEVWLLLRVAGGGRLRYEYLGLAEGRVLGGGPRFSAPLATSVLICLLACFTFSSGIIDQRGEIVPPHKPFAEFPDLLGEWQGRPARLEREVLEFLKATDYWLADYRREGDPIPVNLYIAYYGSQRVGTAAHSPANCLPGSGWQIKSRSPRSVKLPDGGTLTLSSLLIQQGENRQLVYYWFDERGRIMTEQYAAKWYLLVDSLTMHRTDGAVIRLATPLARGEEVTSGEQRLESVLTQAWPHIREFVPGR